MKEFNLSEKEIAGHQVDVKESFYWKHDVKEFIKLLKEETTTPYGDIECSVDNLHGIIDKLAGDKLTGRAK